MPAGHNAKRALQIPACVGLSTAAAIVVALVAYQPHVARPVEAVDFSEFLPLLEGGDSFADRLGALTAYYAGHGRFNVLQYAGTVARWTAFGTWSPGWQLTRMLVMVGAVVLSGALLRRLGASRLGAAAGAACSLAAPAAASGFVRLTMAESVGTVVALAMTLRALGFTDRERWGRDVVWFAAGSMALLLLKEMLAPLLLLPACAAFARRSGDTWQLSLPGRRHAVLAAGAGMAVTTALIPIVLVYARAPASGYVSLLGGSWIPPDAVTALWVAALFPFKLMPERFSVPWLLAVLAWLTIAAVGWGPALSNRQRRTRHAAALAFSLAWPLLGVVIYSPWPAYASFYGLPYLLGASAFLAFGLTLVQRHASHGNALALSAASLIGIVAVTDAQEFAARRQATQVAADRLIEWVADSVSTDSVFVTARMAHRLVMAGPGPTLARHAGATHRPWPPARDIRCDEATLPPSTSAALVRWSHECPVERGPAQVVARFRHVDWQHWRMRTDSVTARVEVATGGS